MIDYLFNIRERIICVKEMDQRYLPSTHNTFYKIKSNKRVRFYPSRIKVKLTTLFDDKEYTPIIMDFRRLWIGDLI